MSYDLAIWPGPRPATSDAATEEYELRLDAMEETLEAGCEPTPAPELVALVEAVLARFPALDEDSGPECPWASAPLVDEIVGDLLVLPMTFSGADDARDVVAQIAAAHGLVCYDPQIETLLPDAHLNDLQQSDAGASSPRGRGGWWTRLFGRKS